MTQPLVVLIYANGCPACSDAKPHFKKLSESLPSWKFGLLDIEKPGLNLDFVVDVTPTLYMQVGNRRFKTDPGELNASFTEAVMRKWVMAVAERVRSGR